MKRGLVDQLGIMAKIHGHGLKLQNHMRQFWCCDSMRFKGDSVASWVLAMGACFYTTNMTLGEERTLMRIE